MKREREEIEKILQKGKNILRERPELETMSLKEVIDELDDGTQEMLHNRWGVTAWLVVKSISDFEMQALIKRLVEIESGVLTYEYAGFLLQNEYHINVEKLLIEAEKYGAFDKIMPYVVENIKFQTKFHKSCVLKMISLLESHINHKSYYTLLAGYSDHIANFGTQKIVAEILDEIDNKTKYNLMSELRWAWYKKSVEEADAIVERMIIGNGIWNKKVAIDFLEVSLHYGQAKYEQYFSKIVQMSTDNEELSVAIIPILVKYTIVVGLSEKRTKVFDDSIQVLKKISLDSLEAKRSFVKAIQRSEVLPRETQDILDKVMEHLTEKDAVILDVLDIYFYRKLENGNRKYVIQNMYRAFVSGGYRTEYQEFFEAMDSTLYKLSEFKIETTRDALDYMLFYGADGVFFGLGILIKNGDFQELEKSLDENSESSGRFDDKQIIRIIKGILYYSFEPISICRLTFQILAFASGNSSAIIKFCIDYVYGNYPETMFQVSGNYKKSNNNRQKVLAKEVFKIHEKTMKIRDNSYKIKDLQPSEERQFVYQRAQLERNRTINKMAEDKSIFAQMFKGSHMKYGKNNAHIVSGKKREKFYQVQPYIHHKYEIELSKLYRQDPVGYEMARRDYLDEVNQDEISS